MTQLNTLLELRTKIKNKKPVFLRQDNPKRPKLSDKWRKPKGIHSKIRHHFKGRRKMPSPGYRSPAEVRGLHSSGLKIVRVYTADEARLIIKDKEGIVLPKSIGKKKRLEILKLARDIGVKVLNVNVDEHIKKIEDYIKSKKKIETKKEEQKVTAKEGPKKPESLTDQEKKEAEKKEKDKVLTKKM